MIVTRLFICSLPLLLTTTLIGQVRFNPKVGWHNYHVAEERSINFDGQGGFIAGADIRFGSATYFQPGVYFLTYNADGRAIFEVAGTTDLLNGEVQFSRLRVPVVLGTSFLEIERFAMRVHIGGVAKVPLGVDDNVFNLTKNNLEDVSVGATVGFGLDMGPVTFGLDYDFGITNTWRDGQVTVDGSNLTILNVGGKSRVVLFTFGLLLGN